MSPNTHLLKMSLLSTFWLLLLPICHEEQACAGRRERFCLRLYKQFEKQKGMHATAACLPLRQPLRQHCFTDLRGNSDFATFLALVLLLLLWRWLLCRNMNALAPAALLTTAASSLALSSSPVLAKISSLLRCQALLIIFFLSFFNSLFSFDLCFCSFFLTPRSLSLRNFH